MEEGASPPRWALDKKLGEDASMEEKKEGDQNWRKLSVEFMLFNLCWIYEPTIVLFCLMKHDFYW